MSVVHQGAIAIVYADRLKERVGGETLVVTGSPRGGTSAIAYALLGCDYFLGDRLGVKNHEDRDMISVFDMDSRRKRRAEFARLAAARNAAHGRWGFKLPKAALFLDEIAAATRNPIALIVTRNPLAVGRSIVGRGPSFPKGPDGLLKAVTLAAERMAAAAKSAQAASMPSILVDFDQFRSDTRANIAFLADTLRLEVDGQRLDEIATAIETPGYKRIEKGQVGSN